MARLVRSPLTAGAEALSAGPALEDASAGAFSAEEAGSERALGDGSVQSGSGHGGAALAGPFTAAQRGGLLTMEPVREARMLRLLWEVEKEEAYVQSRATRLASAVLGSEVEGSLHWLLTRHLRPPLATSVSAGVSYSFSDSSLFSVAVSLTPEGLARHEEVSELVYGAIHLLRETAAGAPSGGGGAYRGRRSSAPC